MSTPTGDNAFLYELELNVKTEMTLAETSQPGADADGAPTIESLLEEEDDQRYELGLRSLLGAIEAVEDVSRPGDDPQAAVRDCYAPTRSAT